MENLTCPNVANGRHRGLALGSAWFKTKSQSPPPPPFIASVIVNNCFSLSDLNFLIYKIGITIHFFCRLVLQRDLSVHGFI